jgi:hypothetical protein
MIEKRVLWLNRREKLWFEHEATFKKQLNKAWRKSFEIQTKLPVCFISELPEKLQGRANKQKHKFHRSAY